VPSSVLAPRAIIQARPLKHGLRTCALGDRYIKAASQLLPGTRAGGRGGRIIPTFLTTQGQ